VVDTAGKNEKAWRPVKNKKGTSAGPAGPALVPFSATSLAHGVRRD